MKVKCIQKSLSESQMNEYGASTCIDYSVTVGDEYLVLGITCIQQKVKSGTGVFFEILNKHSQCRMVPAVLFEIIDNRSSIYWRARLREGGNFVLWPEEFFIEYFHDDLSEDDPEVVKKFQKLVKNMILESGG